MFEEIEHRFSNALSSFDPEQLQILAAYYRAMADQFDARAKQLIDFPSSPQSCKKFAIEVRKRIIQGHGLQDALEECERHFQVDQRLFKADFFKFYGNNALQNAIDARPSNVNKRILQDYNDGLTRPQMVQKYGMPKGKINQIINNWKRKKGV